MVGEEKTITLTVNGKKKQVKVKPNERLIDLLRFKLKLMSVKAGCLTGECGTCTVLYNGEPVKSCMILAAEADGAEIYTVEGLSKKKGFDKIIETFAKHNAFQCGFCTPGFAILTYWLATRKKQLSDDEIKEAMNSILCRCTGYQQIFEAVKEAISVYRSSS